MMRHNDLQMFWPFEDLTGRGLYFYLEAVESYGAHCRVSVDGHGQMLMLGGYSYLNLNQHPRIDQAAADAIARFGTGTHGVRLLAGTTKLHRQLEARIAAFKRTESALVFSSGYFANFSTIASLVGRSDTVICDKLDHASIVDGCLLSQARFVRFHHNDMERLEHCLRHADPTGRRLVVVDAVFSMDGDVIDLPAVAELCSKYDAWLMVDEAHSLGVLGKTGHGIEEHFGLPPDCIDIKMGTLSKAIPSVGGYIAGSAELCRFLSHETRAFIYSASLPPPSAGAALAAFDVLEEEPERVSQLHDNSRYFAAQLKRAGIAAHDGTTAIFPVVVGSNDDAWQVARLCQREGIYVQAIPHPVVPKGSARLRVSINSAHRREDLDRGVSVISQSLVAVRTNDNGTNTD